MLRGPTPMMDPNYSFGDPSSSSRPTSSMDHPLRRPSLSARRYPLAPISALPAGDSTFGSDASPKGSQDSLNHASSSRPSVALRQQTLFSAGASSSRRASLPSYVGSLPLGGGPSPRNSTAYRHRPSVASTITTASASTRTSVDDGVYPYPQQDSRELAGIYKDLQSYVFGDPSPSHSHHLAPPHLAPPRKNSAANSLSGHSTSGASSNVLGITVGASMGSRDYDDSNNSDAGSAYAPENDQDDTTNAISSVSVKRSRQRRRSRANSMAMDIDCTSEYNLSSRRGSTRRDEKKRDRGEEGAVTDEDDSARRNERGKMRALDDGSRRPSLPFNVPPPLMLGSTSHKHDLREDRDVQKHAYPTVSTPTTSTFSTSRPPSSLAPTSATTPSSGLTFATSSSSIPPLHAKTTTRPRSRSHRAAKPLPNHSPPTGMNPDWNPNWANATQPTPPTLPAPLVTPLSPTSVNPFTVLTSSRTRSTTVTQKGQYRSTEPDSLPSSQGPSPSPPPSTTPSEPALSMPTATRLLTPPPEDIETERQSAIADFDLDFIFAGAVQADGSIPGAGMDPARRKASLAPSMAPSLLEDSFVKFVNQFDDEYGERRDKWSFRPDQTGHAGENAGGSLSGHGTAPGGAEGSYWNCANMGRYWVGREGVGGVGDELLHHVGASSLDGFTPDNSIVVRFCPPTEAAAPWTSYANDRAKSFSPPPVGSGPADPVYRSLTPGPPSSQTSYTDSVAQRRSNVRIQVKKHQKAPAFTLYLGPRHPRSLGVSRPTILLAPKSSHIHASVPPKGQRVSSSSSGKAKGGSSLGSVSTSALTTASTVKSSSSGHALSLLSRSSASYKTAEENMSGVIELQDMSRPSGSNTAPPFPHNPPSPPSVSLDLLSVAAATGRVASVHNHAFDTLSPEDGQVILDHLRHRSSLGLRLKRAFGGINTGGNKDGSTASQTSGHGEDHHGGSATGGRDGRSGSPPTGAGSGKHGKDKDHHHSHSGSMVPHYVQSGPLEGAFEPPWMLLTPMYVKEAVVAAERSMYSGFASLGLAAPPSKKNRRRSHTHHSLQALSPQAASFRRNSILESVPNEAMCMVLPLWDLTLDLEEERRKRMRALNGGYSDDLDLDLDDLLEDDEDEDNEEEETGAESESMEGVEREERDAEAAERKKLAREFARRRKMQTPPKLERKYLLTYYVPFNKRGPIPPIPHHSSSAAAGPPVAGSSSESSKKKRKPPTGLGAGGSRPGTAGSDKSGVRSFRVVARILTPLELRDSGLSPPSNISDPKRFLQLHQAHPRPSAPGSSSSSQPQYYSSSLNYSRMDRRLSSASFSVLGGESVVPGSAFSAVIAVCHDRRRGVEFVPEGLDSLGLCGTESVLLPPAPGGLRGGEKLPPLFPPAHLVPVEERLTPPLNAVGKQIVEMIWSGCMALTELGV